MALLDPILRAIGLKRDGRLNMPPGSISINDPAFGGYFSDALLSPSVRAAGNYAYRDNLADATNAIDGRLAGKTFSFTNLAGIGTANLFSTWNNTTHTFVRNPACWAADLDLSCVSVANSANADGTGGNRGCVTLISSTQALTNQHFAQPYQVGVVHYFTDYLGNTFAATVVAGGGQVGSSDERVVTLSPALPTSIKPAKILPPGVTAKLLAAGAPVLAFNQQKQAVVREFVSDDSTNLLTRSALASNRTAWTADVVMGDSDSPTFVVFSGVPYLLTTYTSGSGAGGGGPSLSGISTAINALLPTGSKLTITNPPYLGAAAARDVVGGTGAVGAIDPLTGQFPSGIVPPTSTFTYSEQLWDAASGSITLGANTTTIRVTSVPPPGGSTLTLPAGSANGRTVVITIPANFAGPNAFGFFDSSLGGTPSQVFSIGGTALANGVTINLLATYGASGWAISGPVDGSQLSLLTGKFASSSLTYAPSVTLDFSATPAQTVALTGDITFSTANQIGGMRTVWLRIVGDTVSRNLTFPAWKFLNGATPATLAANKTAVLTLRSWGFGPASVTATYEVQP